MTTTTAFGTCDEYLAAVTDCALVGPEDLQEVQAFLRAAPERGPKVLAEHLVGRKLLTRFQADVVLGGQARSLVLSSFILTEVIGTGGMGAVYKARSSKDGGWYAVKTVPRANVVNLATIAEKVKAFKQVRHPRVSALMHIGASGERVYLVWPFLEGGEKLDAAVRRQDRLPPRLAAQVVLQIASGLQPYHEQALFHGLLKPSDVLIGADRRVRVMDFGVGFLLTSERGKSLLDTMTNNKTLGRGLDCASPESILDPLARTAAGDQYSLGCILYFCLTGQYPFPDQNPVKKMLAHQTEEPTPVEELAPETPPGLSAILRKLMAKAPQERYESIDEVVRELQGLINDSRAMQAPAVRPPVRPAAPSRLAAQMQAAPTTETAGGSRGVFWLILAALALGSALTLAVWFVQHT
jgi:serine/threonine-protein kinase